MSAFWPFDPVDTALMLAVAVCTLGALYAAGKALVWLARRGMERLVVWLQCKRFKRWRR